MINRWIDILASPKMVLWIVPYLMGLVVAGTLVQPEQGLHYALTTYFDSWILWVGPIPLPGSWPVLMALTVCLSLKFILRSEWAWARAGTILAHGGILVLLIGGLWTGLATREGLMTIPEGSRVGYIESYYERELVVEQAGRLIARWPWDSVQKGGSLTHPSLPFAITVEKRCHHCQPIFREASADQSGQADRRGLAARLDLTDLPAERDDEKNAIGAMIRIAGAGTESDGLYFLFEPMPVHPSVVVANEAFTIRLSRVRTALPFALSLTDFVATPYPGTTKAQAYHSDVMVHMNNTQWPVRIEMNKPLRLQGYTFFQSSFLSIDTTTSTVLAVVRNDGWLFPYVASVVIAVGLLLQTIIRFRARAGLGVALALCVGALLVPATAVTAQTHTGLDTVPLSFRTLPILHEGRVKPLESFARSQIQHLAGATTLDGQDAATILARMVFDPASIIDHPVLYVSASSARARLHLPPRPHDRYTLSEVSAAIATLGDAWEGWLALPIDALDPDQRALLDVYDRLIGYTQLLRSLSLILPLAMDVSHDLRARYNLPNGDLTYRDLARMEPELASDVAALIRRKGVDPARYTHTEQQQAALSLGIKTLAEGGQTNHLFRIIPPPFGAQDPAWLSPWGMVRAGQGSPQAASVVAVWQEMGNAFRAGDAHGFDNAAKEAQKIAEEFSGAPPPPLRLLETLYRMIPFYGIMIALYAAAAILIACAGCVPKLSAAKLRAVSITGAALLGGGVLLHAMTIGARMLILARPPVGTFYESVLFVGLLLVIGIIAVRHRFGNRAMALCLAATMGCFFQLVALGFVDPVDTLSPLMAVLNTGFWLATHVVVITAGYAVSLLVAIGAQLGLALRSAEIMNRRLWPLVLLALCLTTFGTLLGGIWADQSWGRFWGWDPKENGALLLVLWLIWCVHARVSQALSPSMLGAALGATSLVVAVSWFGVNLLGTGLHAYGFIDSVGWGLAAFCGVQSTVLIALILHNRGRGAHA